MKILLDTSVLVASFVESHPKHTIAATCFQKLNSKKIKFFVSAHSLIECFAVLTRLPLSPKISPGTARFIIRENIEKQANIISLIENDYLDVISRMTDLNLSGGLIYDALILKAAQKEKVEKIYTFNIHDFQRLSQDSISIEPP